MLPLILVSLYGYHRALYIRGLGELNFAEAIYFAVALERGPLEASLLAAALGIVGDLHRRKRWELVVFNIGWAFAVYTAVGWTAKVLGYDGLTDAGALIPLLAAGAVYFAVASALQAWCQSLLHGMPLRETLEIQLMHMRWSLLSAVCLGGAAAALMSRSPWLVLLLAFPIEVLSSLVEKERLHRELAVTQNALVQSEKRAALGVLAAGVAHEINTPLAAIAVNTHMLRDPRLTAADRDRCVALVEKSTQRAREITDAMLACARPAPAGEPGHPQTALDDALALLRHDLADVEVDADLSTVGTVRIPTGDLVQILTNLLRNARLAMAPGGRITVRGEVAAGGARITVSDTGTGIPSDARDRIWDPFFTTREPGVGSGLGLWIVRNLVEAAGGEVSLVRTGDDGTILAFTVPLEA